MTQDDKGSGRAHDAWLRRQALSISTQLPENQDDAIKVLAYMRDLIEGFMFEKPVKTAVPKAHFSVVRHPSMPPAGQD